MERIVLSQEEYMRRQIEEMFGETNMYYVREKLGREPTKEEVEWWYIEHGGPEDFATRYVQEKVVEVEKKNKTEEVHSS